MPSVIHRPGISFEIAPPQSSHPNRTDIACFVGCVSRLADNRVRGAVPEILARWIESQPELRAAATRDRASLRQTLVALDSAAAFKQSLQTALDTKVWPAAVDELALERLLRLCREYSPVPAVVLETLRASGFVPGVLLGRSVTNVDVARSRAELEGWARIQRLMNLPIRCESFESFAALFAWQSRRVLADGDGPDAPFVVSALGSAVRAFFASGGRTCYVISTGDPIALFASPAERYAALAAEEREQVDAGAGGARPGSFDLALRVPVLPGTPANFPAALLTDAEPSPAPVSTDASTWRGVEHVFGLEDASFVAVPDLVDALAAQIPQIIPPAETLVTAEPFIECVDRPAPARLPIGRRLPAPSLSDQGLAAWKSLLAFTRALLDNQARSFNRRDAQLLASLPLAAEAAGAPTQGSWAHWLAADSRLHSDRIQLGWPWLLTRESGDCQGGVEAPEGTLAGVLSASALRSGSYRSAAHAAVDRLVALEPELDLGQATADVAATDVGDLTLADRVCLIAPTPRGPELISDVTLAADPALRAGSVRRLVNVVIAQARTLGEELVFESNGEGLWRRIVERLEDFGRMLLAVGALSTDAGSKAFVARCGRNTMSQADIDDGRVIAEIGLVPAQPIVTIVVVLDLRDAGFLSVGAGAEARAA